MRTFLFLQSSARSAGNSLALAQRAAAGLPAGDATRWEDLTAPPLPAFRDARPAAEAAPTGRLRDLHAACLWATDIVFVAPLYWYGLPAPAKLFLDHWSGWLNAPDTGFATAMAGRRLWLISARADPDPTLHDPLVAQMRHTAQWLGMAWGGALLGIGDAPGEVAQDAAAWARAPGFFAA